MFAAVSELSAVITDDNRGTESRVAGQQDEECELLRREVDPAAGDRDLVAGHVDGVGIVAESRAVTADASGSWYLAIEAPSELARFIAPKGSIAVHGVSLTVNTVEGAHFAVNLIPHTLDVTTFKDFLPGAMVNLEVDMVARYVARLAECDR